MSNTLFQPAAAPPRAAPKPPPCPRAAAVNSADLRDLKQALAGKLKELIAAKQKLTQVEKILTGAGIPTQDAAAGQVPQKFKPVADRYVAAKEKVAELVRLCRDMQNDIQRKNRENAQDKPQPEQEQAPDKSDNAPRKTAEPAQQKTMQQKILATRDRAI